MASLNKVILIGNLGKDPEMRFLPNGDAVANFSIATSESWKDKTTGVKQEKTEWHNIVAFGKLAKIVEQYLKKGTSIYAEGRLQTRKWTDKTTGQDRYSTEIVIDQMKMLNGAPAGGGSSQAPSPAPQRAAAPAAAPQKFDDFEDDIPF